jgi:hypothetical protein
LYRVGPSLAPTRLVAPVVPDLLTLETLADVRTLVEKHCRPEYRVKFTWRQLAGLLKRAAEARPRCRLR